MDAVGEEMGTTATPEESALEDIDVLATQIVGSIIAQVASAMAEHPEYAPLSRPETAQSIDSETELQRLSTADVHDFSAKFASRIVSSSLAQYIADQENEGATDSHDDAQFQEEEEAADAIRPTTAQVKELSAGLAQEILDNSIAQINDHPDYGTSRPQTTASSAPSISRPPTAQLQGYSESFVETVFKNAISLFAQDGGALDFDKAKTIINAIINAWQMSDRWKYTMIDVTSRDSSGRDGVADERNSRSTVVKVMWSIPMRRRPVPNATAATFFTLTQRGKGDLTVRWRLEEQLLMHSATNKCREQWLHDVLARKRAIQQQINIDDL